MRGARRNRPSSFFKPAQKPHSYKVSKLLACILTNSRGALSGQAGPKWTNRLHPIVAEKRIAPPAPCFVGLWPFQRGATDFAAGLPKGMWLWAQVVKAGKPAPEILKLVCPCGQLRCIAGALNGGYPIFLAPEMGLPPHFRETLRKLSRASLFRCRPDLKPIQQLEQL